MFHIACMKAHQDLKPLKIFVFLHSYRFTALVLYTLIHFIKINVDLNMEVDLDSQKEKTEKRKVIFNRKL
jgi:hypothetical protein